LVDAQREPSFPGKPARRLRCSKDMKIDPWMKHPLITVKPHDSALHAREVMEKHRINQLPVVVDGRLVGIVTDRDLRDVFPSVMDSAATSRRRRPAGTDPATIPVEDIMAHKVVTLAPGAFVADAARLMRRERIGSIPVVDGDRLVGILTRSDVLDAYAELSDRALPSG
jgi:acetoin utilization protein AcuB